MPAWIAPVRRLASRLAGTGPWRVAPCADIATSEAFFHQHGVYGRDASGVVATVPGDSVRYRPAAALLGQPLPETGYPAGAIAAPRDKTLFALNDAGVMGNQGLVYDRKSRTAVAETAGLWHGPATRNPLLGTLRFPAPVRLPGLSVSLLTRSNESFYHFLVEGLAKLHLLGTLRDDVQQFIVNGPPDSFARGWLEQAGVPASKLVWASPLSHFVCEQLLFTNDLCYHQQPTAWNVAAVRAVTRWQPPAARGRRAVWLSRAGAYTRRIAWERELAAALPQLEVHDFGAMTPAAQLALCAETGLLIGPHGAGFSNIVFCPPGTRQVELFSSVAAAEPLYSRLAQVSGSAAYFAAIDFADAGALPRLVDALRPLLGELTA